MTDDEQIRARLAKIDVEQLLGLIPAFADALKRIGTNDWLMKPSVFAAFQTAGFNVTQNHFYSVIPDVASLPESLWSGEPWRDSLTLPSKEEQLAFAIESMATKNELANVPLEAAKGFYWNNPMLSPLDALVYYGLIREKRPKRVFEIGSGFSTHLATRAVGRNQEGEITCIEPYPTNVLRQLKGKVRLIEQPIQAVDPKLFTKLEAGDVLFVDTTHTVKIGSDVNHIFCRILPGLADGVWVHIHDIFLPMEYPRAWIKDLGILWNEQYLLLAFLCGNPSFRPLLANYYLSGSCESELVKMAPRSDFSSITMNMGGMRGASFWMQKDR